MLFETMKNDSIIIAEMKNIKEENYIFSIIELFRNKIVILIDLLII